jgi:hypothetical protein
VFVTHLMVENSRIVSGVADAFYGWLSVTYALPGVQTLCTSLKKEVQWESEAEVYFLDNLKEAQAHDLFLVRTPLSMKQASSIFLYVQEGRVIRKVDIQFPARGSRGDAEKMISTLKDMARDRDITSDEFPVLVEGWSETEPKRIAEKYLTGFKWSEAAGRTFHISESPLETRDAKRLRRRY